MTDDVPVMPGESPSDGFHVTTFDEATTRSFTDYVMRLAKEPSDPIIVYVNSYGGSLYELFGMLAVMDSVENRFITICTGKAMSAGAVLLAHGDVRCAGSRARVMLHQASGGFWGHVEDAKVQARELADCNRQALQVLARDCGKSPRDLRTLLTRTRDVYFSAELAQRYGLIDHVGIPIVRRGTRYSLRFVQGAPARTLRRKTERSTQ